MMGYRPLYKRLKVVCIGGWLCSDLTTKTLLLISPVGWKVVSSTLLLKLFMFRGRLVPHMWVP